MGLLRVVDQAIADPQDPDGKQLKAIRTFIGQDDPILALELLITKVIL